MKRSLLALALLAVVGTASAQSSAGTLRFKAAAATFLTGNIQYPNGLAGSAPFFLAGNTVEGFDAGRNGFGSFVVVLTEDAPRLHGLRDKSVEMFNKSYDALLPTYVVIDKFAKPLAAPAAPITVPVGSLIVVGARTFTAGLNGVLPGMEGLSMR